MTTRKITKQFAARLRDRVREHAQHHVDACNEKRQAFAAKIAAAIEKEGPVDLEELGAIAGAEGGKLLSSPSELMQAVESIPSRTTTELFKTPHAMWDSWLTIAVILLLLSVEWWLRKMWNLL